MDFLGKELEDLRARGLLRSLKRVDPREVVNFCSNNYLGLADDPRLKQAASEAAGRFGAGSGAARLISGNSALAEELESALARFKQTESALLFNSGYHANIGAIPALAGPDGLIFSDALNHASLIDGCRLSGVSRSIYRHNDLNHLESLLKASACLRGLRLIVTEAVFSMEGDLCPLPDLLRLADRYGAFVYLDEAHAVGVLGKQGRGLVEHFKEKGESVDRGRLVEMGTLGKAFGSYGAFLAGTRTLRDYLINKARSFIFTTALPPAILAASRAAVQVIEGEPGRRERLWRHVETIRRGGLFKGGESPIFSFIVGEPAATMEISRRLFEKGIFVQGIRPPTVPEGTSRLRITLSAAHTDDQIAKLLGALKLVERAA